MRYRVLAVLFVVGCSHTPSHGRISELSAEADASSLCEHAVPAEVCTRCHPELSSRFQAVGDWCGEHGVPESQCLTCHPDLTFDPLPTLIEGADVATLSQAGEDVVALAPHVAPGKVTVFDFFADWCAPCRNIEAHLRRRINEGGSFAVRRLNLVSWETPLAKRYLTEVTSLPYLVIYGPGGNHVRTLSGYDLDALDAALQEAAR